MLGRALVGAVATLWFAAQMLSIVAHPAPAFADAVGDKKAQAAALASEINADELQVQILDQQFDGAQYRLQQVQQQLATSQTQLGAAQATILRTRKALAGEVVLAYMNGGLAARPTVRSYNGAVDLPVQAAYFQLATGNQTQALDQFRASEAALRQRQTELTAAQQANNAALTQVTSKRQAVQSATATTQTALSQVKGELVQLVAEQQAQIQAQQAARVKASLLASQAAQAGSGSTQGRTTSARPQATPPAAAAASNRGSATTALAASTTKTGSGTAGNAQPSTPTTQAPVTSTTVPTAPVSTAAPNAAAAKAIAYARAQIGKPYAWGADGPGSFDCSGLTMQAWAAAGVSLPHFAAAQYADTTHVAIADLEPGDLVFFGTDIHHVGLYIGDGQMIDAPFTGANVRVDTIYWPDLEPFGGRP